MRTIYIPKVHDFVLHKLEMQLGYVNQVDEYEVHPHMITQYTLSIIWLYGGISGLLDSEDVMVAAPFIAALKATGADVTRYENDLLLLRTRIA